MALKLTELREDLRQRVLRQMAEEDAGKKLVTAIKNYTEFHDKGYQGPTSAKRIRQDAKPVLNGLETAWRDHLAATLPNGTRIHEQALRFQIGRGAWYKPDLCAWVGGQLCAWECKGPKQMKNVARGVLALKAAAHQFPEVRFALAWREVVHWRTQAVLP